MGTYVYNAVNKSYLKECGIQNARSAEALTAELESKNLSGISVFETKSSVGKNLVSLRELAIFCRQMSVVFFSNITLTEGVRMLSDQAANKHLKIVLSEAGTLLENGITFGEVISMYTNVFTPYMISMVKMGESGGTLDLTFDNLSTYFEKESHTRKRVRTAVSYPIMLSVLMFALILLLIIKILPMFDSMLSSMGGQMEPYTKVILSASQFVSSNFLWIAAIVIVLIIVFMLFRRTKIGKRILDKIKITFPVSKYIYVRIFTARFSRSLGVLLKSGIQLLNAFDYITVLVDNSYVSEKYSKMVKEVKNGEDFIESLENVKLFPPMLIKMIKMGNTTGKLDEMLYKSADIFDDEVDEALERLTLLIEPVLIILLSLIVGFILLSVMIPMINIMAAIG